MEPKPGQVLDVLSDLVEKAMKICYERTKKGSKLEFRPFFVLFDVIDSRKYYIKGADGQIYQTLYPNGIEPLNLRSEMRIGDYDQCGHSFGSTYLSRHMSPYSLTSEVLNLVNKEFWKAMKDFEYRSADSEGIVDPNRTTYLRFSKEQPIIMPVNGIVDAGFLPLDINKGEWEEKVAKVSRELIDKKIYESSVEFHAEQVIRYLVSSEGTKIAYPSVRYSITLQVDTYDRNNCVLELSDVFHSTEISKLPALEKLVEAAKNLVKTALEIRKAPIQEPGEYPTIMDGFNHGTLWHEAIGHSLEASRKDETKSTKKDGEESLIESAETFKDKLGKRVTAKFISVYDDPILEGMNGSYTYDHEGVRAQRVVLIEKGVLRNYLHNRETAGREGIQSNGHARIGDIEDDDSILGPQPRMSNLIIESNNRYPFEQLKEMLIEECKKQGREYGLLFKNVDSGTSFFDDGFHVSPREIYRVNLDGSMERVRGVRQVGTPFTILKNIIATGDEPFVSNGFCGAESGWVPATETAPCALFSSVEVAPLPPKSYKTLNKRVVPFVDPKDFVF